MPRPSELSWYLSVPSALVGPFVVFGAWLGNHCNQDSNNIKVWGPVVLAAGLAGIILAGVGKGKAWPFAITLGLVGVVFGLWAFSMVADAQALPPGVGCE